MRGRWRGALLLTTLLLGALLAATPAATAGTASDPDVVDEADRADEAADLRAGWVEHAAEGARFTVQVERAPQQLRDHVYYFQFRVAGEFVFAAVGVGGDGVLRGHLGSYNGPDWERGGFERVANGRLVDLAFEPGAPARLSATIPWGAYDGLQPGATLVDIAAGTAIYERASWGQWDGGWWEGGYDEAQSNRVVVLSQARLLDPLGGDAALGWALGLAIVGGVLGGAGATLYRRRRPGEGEAAAAAAATASASLEPTANAPHAARGAPPRLLAGRPPT